MLYPKKSVDKHICFPQYKYVLPSFLQDTFVLPFDVTKSESTSL